MDKILVYCPMAPKTPKVYARTVTSLFRLEWSGEMEIVFGREDEPRQSKYGNLAAKHNRARHMALDGGYDALLFVENDMILPPDALTKLAAVKADVAYGLYVNRHGWRKWLAYTYIDDLGGVSLSDDKDKARAAWGKVIDTVGAGMGCTLIRRNVLEHIWFRVPPGERAADDWQFAIDCQAAGFRQAHDLSVHCGHIVPGNAHILWPDASTDDLFRVEWFNDSQLIKAGTKVEVNVGMGVKEVWGAQ